MRDFFRLSALMMALLSGASLLQAQMPPSGPPAPASASRENKGTVKRGVHWYRHPARPTPIEQEAHALSLFKASRLRAAANAYQALVYAWPDSPQAATAQLALAGIQQARQRYNKAFDEYQYLIDNYAGTFNYIEVVEQQFQIANHLMSAKRGRFLIFPGFEAPERALPLFESIIRNAPSWEKAPLAQLNIGMIHEADHNPEEAIAAYEVLLNRYPGSQWAPGASYHQACCLEELSSDRLNDESALNAARSALVDFILTYPDSSGVPDARVRLDKLNIRRERMAFERAHFYDRLAKRPEAALPSYEDFVKRFPSSESIPLVRERIEILKSQIKGAQSP
jgi:outer membrane protein assembly factor BamD (BamD/ComL family)